MSTLDIIVLFLVGALGLKGFLHGFVKEIAGLAAIVGGIFLASRFSGGFGDFFVHILNIKNETAAHVVSFIALFAALWFGITLLASFVSKAIDVSGFGIADKILGFGIAGGKIYLILSVIVFAISNVAFLNAKFANHFSGSFLYSPMVSTGGFIMKLKPEDLNASNISQKVKEEMAKEALKEANITISETKK